MRKIDTNIKVKAIRLFVSGVTFDEIVRQLNISKGSVVNTVNEFREGKLRIPPGMTGYIDALRHLVVDLKKHDTTVNQLQSYSRLHSKLIEMGASSSEAEQWLETCRELATQTVSCKQFVKSAIELERLSSKTGLDYEALLSKYEEMTAETDKLNDAIRQKHRELLDLQSKYNAKKKQAAAKLDMIQRGISAAHDRRDKTKKEAQLEIKKYLKEHNLSWNRIETVEAVIDRGTKSNRLTAVQKNTLLKRIIDAGSIHKATEKLRAEWEREKSEVRKLSSSIDHLNKEIAITNQAKSALETSTKTQVEESKRLNNILEVTKDTIANRNEELNDKCDILNLCRSLIDFLLISDSIQEEDLERLIDLFMKIKRSKLINFASGINEFANQYGVPVLNNSVENSIDSIKVAKEALAYLIAPYFKGELVPKPIYELARAGYEIIQKDDGIVEWKQISERGSAALIIPLGRIEEVMELSRKMSKQ